MITLIMFLGPAPGATDRVALRTTEVDGAAFGRLLDGEVLLDPNGRTGVLKRRGGEEYHFEYITAGVLLS